MEVEFRDDKSENSFASMVDAQGIKSNKIKVNGGRETVAKGICEATGNTLLQKQNKTKLCT